MCGIRGLQLRDRGCFRFRRLGGGCLRAIRAHAGTSVARAFQTENALETSPHAPEFSL